MKILLIGLGSIGRRHLDGLKMIDELDLAALRTLKGTWSKLSDIQEFYSLEDALKFKPDGVIVCNPTSLHVESALPFLEKGIKVLIEKPVSHQMDDTEKLLPYAESLRVAYCMRFHPLNRYIKEILLKEKVFKMSFRRSFFLPKWHPDADYKKEYTASKELGGGAIRTLSHEIDLMIHWMGAPLSVTGVVDKVSDLEISTDDSAFFTCGFNAGGRVNFDLDFLSPVNINTGELFTDQGRYVWDMTGMWFTPYQQEVSVQMAVFYPHDLDRMYADQLIDFIGFINGANSRNATLEECVELQRIIDKIEN